MRVLKNTSIIFISLMSVVFFSCASSTGSRYSKDSNGSDEILTDKSSGKQIVKLDEDFDITPYKIKIEVPENDKSIKHDESEVWYDYQKAPNDKQQKTLVGTEEGFRVLVLSSDNLEEAEQTKSEIENMVDDNELYINFEPPFYKLKVGDFENPTSAQNLRFKLNQLGYKEARVIKETINVFK